MPACLLGLNKSSCTSCATVGTCPGSALPCRRRCRSCCCPLPAAPCCPACGGSGSAVGVWEIIQAEAAGAQCLLCIREVRQAQEEQSSSARLGLPAAQLLARHNQKTDKGSNHRAACQPVLPCRRACLWRGGCTRPRTAASCSGHTRSPHPHLPLLQTSRSLTPLQGGAAWRSVGQGAAGCGSWWD